MPSPQPHRFGVQKGQDPFALLGINPETGNLAMARTTLAEAGAFWSPTVDPDEYEPAKLEHYRVIVHAYLILATPGLWGAAEAARAGLGLGGILDRCPYPDIASGEADPDWVLHFLQHASAEAEEERESNRILAAELLSDVGNHLQGLPEYIAGDRITEISTFRVGPHISSLRTFPEIDEKQLPKGTAPWAFIWRTSTWEADGATVFFDIKALNDRARTLWTGRSVAPYWEVTINMQAWLAMDGQERRAMVHAMLCKCHVSFKGDPSVDETITYKASVLKPTLKADGYHLARFGATTIDMAFQIAAAFYHPKTRALLEEAEAGNVSNRYDLRPAGDLQEDMHLEDLPPANSAKRPAPKEADPPTFIDDQPRDDDEDDDRELSPFATLAASAGIEVRA